MPNPVWPPTLPQDVFAEGYDETLPNTMLRTQMDAGPAKTRRRSTAGVRPLTVTIELNRTLGEDAAFDEFFTDTLGGGTLSFDWTHPRTLATVTMRFTAPPHLQPLAGGKFWRAMLNLEVMP